MKTRPIIIDACTLINLIRIDEDDMLYNYLLTFNIKIAECVYKEIKNNRQSSLEPCLSLSLWY